MAERSDAEILSDGEYLAMTMIVAWLTRQNEHAPFDADQIMLKLNPVAGYMLFGIDSDGTVIKNNDVVRAAMIMIWSLVIEMSEATDRTIPDLIASIGLNVARHDPKFGKV